MSGAAGFVGANLVRRLIEDGHIVHGIVRPGSDRWRLHRLSSDISVHEANLIDHGQVASLVQTVRPDWVFHLAAYGAYPTQKDLFRMIQTNVAGLANLLDAALRRGFEAFVNTGSSSEYGLKDHAPLESESLEPNSDYAVTKAAATLLCTSLAQRHAAPIRTLRLYSVYGPYEDPNRLIPTLIVRGRRGELPPLVDPDIARDFVEVSDVTDAYLRAACTGVQEPGAIYNVGSGLQTSIRDVVTVAERVLGFRAAPVWASMPAREWDTKVWVANADKIRQTLGWRPSHTLESGFSAMARWFADNPDVEPVYSAVPST